jgi:Ca-activated chloride channel family protein
MRAIASLLFLAIPTAISAQGIIIPRCRPSVECPPIGGAQVVRTRSDVKVELRDRVLRYEVEERFLNRGGTIGEADYIFPLPKNAAFRDLKLSIDGELVAGETMNAVEARRIYEDIVRRQRDPALVEWMGHGMLRTRIFPIQPGEERRVVVRFESVAEREGDAVRVDYFRGQSTQAPGPQPRVRPASAIERPFADPAGRTTFALTYRAGGELGEAYSPTHELDVERNGALREVSIRGGGPDITVLVALRRSNAASVALLTHATRSEPGYALITVTPPTDLASNRTSRDVTFVIDVSGSMSGRKLEQAKAAGRQLLRTLTDRDRFRIIDFSTDVRSFRDEFVLASDANVRAGLRYLEDLEAVGSTNISGALEEALRGMRRVERHWDVESRPEDGLRAERLSLVLFITDGAPTVGDRDPGSIAARAARLRGDARVFSVGMGADVNVGLIEQLALEGRGTAHFVRPEESVERAVELLATRLRQPLLTDVRIVADGDVRLTRMYPSGPQDIFAGQDLVLLARYEGSGSANVVVTGNAGGRRVRWSSARNFARDERDNAFVPRLWATHRIGWLSAEKRRSGGSSEIDAEIRMLGERFGIPTEFTSYLVLEPGMVAGNVMRDTTRVRRVAGGAVGGRISVSRGEVPPAAAAPATIEFESARTAARQRSAKSVAAADEAMDAAAAAGMRRVGARVFQQDGDRWVDARMKPDLRVYKVKAYSAAYFSLIEKVPELREVFAIGDRVLVAGRNVAIEVVEEGADLAAQEVETIVRNW